MYKIVGSDGKTYGPISLEQLKQWAVEGRVNPQTEVQTEGAADWKKAAEIPELAALFPGGALLASSGPPPITTAASGAQQSGLAVTSLVLGVLSLVCFGILTGVPAIICGHIARDRARRLPAQYGGAGLALAGLVLGYIATVVTFLILPAMLLPALARAKDRAQRINCTNNLKQLGLAFKTWELDNGGRFPFNVSTNQGGTFEFHSVGPGGYDVNGALHLAVLSNELATPRILVCPADSKQPATDFRTLTAANVTYQIYSGTNLSTPQAVLAVCPIHGNVLLSDGSFQYLPARRRK